MEYRAIVMGCSAGGFDALERVLRKIDRDFQIPIAVVQHVSPDFQNNIACLLNSRVDINIKAAEEKEKLCRGNVYIAPRDYHLLVEDDETFSLSMEPHVNFSRPSVDPLFESAADVYRESLIGIILTGSNHDGSEGLKRIKNLGGMSIVQNPDSAYAFEMPRAAIETAGADYILELDEISEFLNGIVKGR